MSFQIHKDFTEAKVNAFACDLTIDDLCAHVAPSSVDIVTMVIIVFYVIGALLWICFCSPLVSHTLTFCFFFLDRLTILFVL